MTAIRVFDPAMCCSTGVCGPAIDPQLARFSADLEWVKSHGISVERFNLAQQPAAFAEDDAVRAALHAQGEASLPFIKVNGEVRSSGVYPSRSDLAMWAGLEKPASKLRIKITPAGPVCCTPSDAATSADANAPPAVKCC